MNKKLILFDLDGTLSEYKTGALLPNVKAKIAALPEETLLAIVSNQGGVGLRYWMEKDGFGNPSQYPTEAGLRELIGRVTGEIGRSFGLYLCFAYQSMKTSQWNPVPRESDNPNFWRREWRKPNPGMIAQALQDYAISPEETLMVGDWAEDELAAAAAGVDFMWAWDFFERDKPEERR